MFQINLAEIIPRKYVVRQAYLDKIKPYIGKNIVKVITGQRRVGKSYLMLQLLDTIKHRYPDSTIIYINKELYQFDHIRTYDDLLQYVEKNKQGRDRIYVLIDEIQEIASFERAIRSLHAEGKFDIFCTGSNAAMMSGELASLLSGRYIEIKVFCLSYPEFLLFHQLEDTAESFMKYIKYGGLPYLKHLPLEDDIVYEYLISIYNTILFKDVVARNRIRNVNFLERLTEYLADNIGQIISAKKISDFLKSQKINISPNVVLNYLSHLEDAFFILKARRSDITGKKVFEIGEKYYFEDTGLRHSLIGYSHRDIGKIMENIIFCHLVSAGYRVTIGVMGTKEVDFVCDRHGKRFYVQSAYRISDEDTHDREFGNLLAIPDNFPKFVVTMDEPPPGSSYKGIAHISIREFLRMHPEYI